MLGPGAWKRCSVESMFLISILVWTSIGGVLTCFCVFFSSDVCCVCVSGVCKGLGQPPSVFKDRTGRRLQYVFCQMCYSYGSYFVCLSCFFVFVC